MKTNDVNDPLKKNDLNEKQPETEHKEPLKEEKENKQPPPPVPGKLSPQQVKNILEAMNNEEKKVQEKINSKKQPLQR
jgi:Ca-activated chloride channel family protein